MLPKTIANYKILNELGEGGIGTVYLAENINIGSKVVIKMLNPHFLKSDNSRILFLKEAKTQANLNHPNITKVIDFIDNENGLFIILEYLEGEPLNKYLFKSKGVLSESDANYFMGQILDAVGYAHTQNVLHGDLKSANIMITPNKIIKVMDFGLSKLANETLGYERSGFRFGNPIYKSPEQVTKDTIDFRSDIYSLGVIYHEMLSGTPVYNQSSASEFEIYNKIVKEPLPRLKEFNKMNSEKAQQIVDTATAKLPIARYQSCAEFKDNLNNEEQYTVAISTPHKYPEITVNDPKQQLNKPFVRATKLPKKGFVLVIFAIIILISGGAFLANNESLWKQSGTDFEQSLKTAEEFSHLGNYRKAYDTYEQIIKEAPNHPIANQRMVELRSQSLLFQEESLDSLFQQYLQVLDLNAINLKDNILGARIVEHYEHITTQMNRLMEDEKIVGSTQPIDYAHDQYINAYQYFLSLEQYKVGSSSELKANSSNKNDDPSLENIQNKKQTENFAFSQVQNPPIFPGCNDSDPRSQSECFNTKITAYLSTKINRENYQSAKLDTEVHRSLFSFKINDKGSLKNIVVRSSNRKIKRDIKSALRDLKDIKPAIQNNAPVEVFYSGSFSIKLMNDGNKDSQDTNDELSESDLEMSNENSADGPQVALTSSYLFGKWLVENRNAHYVLNDNYTGSYSNNRGRKKTFNWSLVGFFLNIKMDDGVVFVWQITSQTSNKIIMDDMQNNEFNKVLKRM